MSDVLLRAQRVYVKVYLGSACINAFYISRAIRTDDDGRRYVVFRGDNRYIEGEHNGVPLIKIS